MEEGGGREGRRGVEVVGVDRPEEGVREGGSEGVLVLQEHPAIKYNHSTN